MEHTAVVDVAVELAVAADRGEAEYIVVEVAAVAVVELFSADEFVVVAAPSEAVPEACVAVEMQLMMVVTTSVHLRRKNSLESYW